MMVVVIMMMMMMMMIKIVIRHTVIDTKENNINMYHI